MFAIGSKGKKKVKLKAKIIGWNRPTNKKIDEICGRGVDGIIKFKDVAFFEIKEECVINNFEMYYNKDLVAMRKTPDILVWNGDTLILEWTLKIENEIATGTLRIVDD